MRLVLREVYGEEGNESYGDFVVFSLPETEDFWIEVLEVEEDEPHWAHSFKVDRQSCAGLRDLLHGARQARLDANARRCLGVDA